MKLTFKQIEPFVQNPDPSMRVILIYGPDSGLMSERMRAIASHFVDNLNDPFNTCVLTPEILNEDPARLSDEANAVSMMSQPGDKRLIRIQSASDKVTLPLKSYLEDPNPNAVVIVEASDLGPSSKLRTLCEKDKQATAIPCYVEDERGLSQLIRQSIQAANMRIDPDAVTWLSINIAGDRAKVRMELDKLVLYKSGDDQPQITLDDVKAACGEAGAQSMDDLVYSIAGGQPPQVFRAYQLLIEDGVVTIAILRALQNHFRKLHLTKCRILNGDSVDQAVNALQPKIFFKYASGFKTQAHQWSLPAIETAMARLVDLEAQSKMTGTPVETLCSQAILGLCKMPRNMPAKRRAA
jgi:DNA polymerase-3 subunit delta